mmetsp:Transcript_42876/g.135430  ORF Transcript_42876/g.135430 Transcript_42876/m.135430 type:complete len:221 (+) Transcript_42876:175-837(+)
MRGSAASNICTVMLRDPTSAGAACFTSASSWSYPATSRAAGPAQRTPPALRQPSAARTCPWAWNPTSPPQPPATASQPHLKICFRPPPLRRRLASAPTAPLSKRRSAAAAPLLLARALALVLLDDVGDVLGGGRLLLGRLCRLVPLLERRLVQAAQLGRVERQCDAAAARPGWCTARAAAGGGGGGGGAGEVVSVGRAKGCAAHLGVALLQHLVELRRRD